jgi:hypothetical protein
VQDGEQRADHGRLDVVANERPGAREVPHAKVAPEDDRHPRDGFPAGFDPSGSMS